MVNESLIIQKGESLVGLVYPDYDEAHSMGLSDEDLEQIMEQNRQSLNESLPAYCRLSSIRLHTEEFEKTPKKVSKDIFIQSKGGAGTIPALPLLLKESPVSSADNLRCTPKEPAKRPAA